MSRRKQSNPKPLKRDEFWNEAENSENGGAERSPADGGAAASDAADGKPDEEPKLKVNASLATDPALREAASSPADAGVRFKPELFPAAAAAGPSAAVFCLPAVPDTSARPVKQENLEAAPQRQGKRPFGAEPVATLSNCFLCQPCNIKFSSRSTLEAHQTYYCSHRASVAPPRPASPATPLTGKEGSSDTEPGSPGEGGEEAAPPAAKVARRQYACPHCSYSADKKVSLNRHMRMHAAAPASPAPAPSTPEQEQQPAEAEAAGTALPPPALDRYCANCDIRFSNVRTYKAHKAHYCDTRHVVKPNAPSSPANASQASSGADLSRVGSAGSPEAGAAAGQAYLALPTTPVLLVPYHLVQAASLVTAPALPAGAAHPGGAACLVLLNGAVQPLELPPERPATPPPPPPAPRRAEKPHRQQPQASSEASVNGATFPLDLSLPRSGGSGCGSDPEDEKENRGLNTSSPSQGSSRASSPASASPRPHLRLNGAAVAAAAKKQPEAPPTPPDALRKTPTALLPPHLKLPKQLLVPELLGPLLGSQLALLQRPLLGSEAFQAAVGAASAPQILVKQGTAKCESCNIVFCKLENFEVHKQYYCQGRSRPDAPPAAGAAEAAPTATPSPPAPAAAAPTQTQAKLLQQFICGNCGIKFTSLNNLKAHQTYYCRDNHLQPANNCTNNNDPPPQDKKKCPKCKASVGCGEEGGHECVGAGGGAVSSSVLSSSGWRCPCCRSHLPTATAAQKHLEEQHAGLLRGFRCTICSYRGNTLRGMRTHIRAHLLQPPAAQPPDAKPDAKEEDFIACVLHEELDAAAAASGQPADEAGAECSECDSHASPSPRPQQPPPAAEAAAT